MLKDVHDRHVQAVTVAAAHKSKNGVLERIVHDGIELSAEKITAAHAVGAFCRSILPDLADHRALWVFRLDGGRNLVEKRVGKLIGHIEPPTRNARAHPLAQHAVFPADKRAVGRFLFVEIRKLGKTPPAVVFIGPVFKLVPAAVRAVGIVVRAAVSVTAELVEINAVGAGMVKHAVKDDRHSVSPGLGAKRAQIRLAAEQRVNFFIVGRVVAMVGMGLKNWIEIEHRHAKAFQIGQLLNDAAQIAAEIV